MSQETTTKIVTLLCERSADLRAYMDDTGQLKDLPGVEVVKFPCSGMIQPLMIDSALKAGASGVIVCGCQLGDCYYREGNKMIRERLLGERPPGLKKTVDRRRVLALWLSRLQARRFISEAKEFIGVISELTRANTQVAQSPKPSPEPSEQKGTENT